MKTIQEILEDWDNYKNKYIDNNEDWTKKHDNYLNQKFFSKQDIIDAIEICKDKWNGDLYSEELLKELFGGK